MNEAGVGAGYFQCMNFSKKPSCLWLFLRGRGGGGGDMTFPSCSSLALQDFLGEWPRLFLMVRPVYEQEAFEIV